MSIRASRHLRDDTWLRRGDPADTVLTAWERGQPLDISEAPNGHAHVPDHDEARYDPVTQTVIFRRNETLTTCYSVRREETASDHSLAARQAVAATYGIPEEHRPTENRDSNMEFTEP